MAGGLSRRFGSDKARAELQGRPLLQWVAKALAAECSAILVSHAAGQDLPPLSLEKPVRFVEDAHPERGPLGGLVTALPEVETEYCVVASTDVPLLSPAVVRLLAKLVEGHDVALPLVGGHRQPLVAAYRAAGCAPVFREALFAGEGRVLKAIEALDVRIVQQAELVSVDPLLNSFRNANTPTALAEITASLEGA